MSRCYDAGALRAFLDNQLPDDQRAALAAHLGGCLACRRDLEAVRAAADTASALLAPPPSPDPNAALARFRAARNTAPTPIRRNTMAPTRILRRWLAPLGAVILAVTLLALPPVRAAADQLLQVFRVQTVVFVPVSRERMEQIESLDIEGKSLFVAEPKLLNEPAEPRTVADVAEAEGAVGFPVEQPAALPSPPTSTSLQVSDRTIAEFQVNVQAARDLLSLAGVNDVTLPDALGAQPITVDMAPAVVAEYKGDGYTAELVQGRAPVVNMPEGVDLSQLGRAALRVLGLSPEQADALSSQIDWSSTLLFPFPADLSSVRQVSINGAPGLLTTGSGRGSRDASLYWQRGDRFYILQFSATGSDDTLAPTMIQIAESVR